MALLDQDRAEAERRRVALDGEQLGEVGHGENVGVRDGGLERCDVATATLSQEKPSLSRAVSGAAIAP
jgi:hypothetical protein